jgi:hypothetical protein
MSQQQTFGTGGSPTPPSDINTLSSEDGAKFSPVGNNFNFSGSVAGGASANGAILFDASDGEMDAKVQVDGTTVTINSSNQLQATTGLKWQVQTADLMAVKGNGYFADSAVIRPTGLSVTLPTTSAVGDTFAVYDFNGNGWAISYASGQSIRVGTLVSTVGTGSVVSAAPGGGDTVTLVCAVANLTWMAVDYDGNIGVN